MYIPKLRRISDVLYEMKTKDPKTMITRNYLLFLLKTNKITKMKYGNSWVINLDELYGYLNGIRRKKSKKIVESDSRLVSSGTIQRAFAYADEGTIVRRPNLRRFVRDNGITYFITEELWLIDKDSFMQKVNPKRISEEQQMPRLRCIKTAVIDWNRIHRPHIDKHTVENCLQSKNVFAYKFGNRWIINYDQLEVEIREFIRAKKKSKQDDDTNKKMSKK